jgi:4-hydroxybenzoate polyprenyltransferase
MSQYDEASLQAALKEVEAGVSQRKAAARWGVPRATIYNRINGRTTRTAIAEARQRLSKQQERHLAGWILTQDSLGLPPSHSQIQELAARILIESGDLEPIGKHWIEGFIRRNPEVKTLRGKRIDFLRINGATTDRVKDFFALKEIPEVRAISPQHRYNMDEAGIMEGLGDNGLVLGSSRKKFALRRQPGSRAWTSVLECINALGIALPPLIIFKGKSVQQQWFPQELQAYAEWFFTASDKGWTDDSIALAWLREIFIPLTKPATKTKRLLILDGHGSHETDEFMWECYKNDIYLLFLPSHSSHVLQPLDISIFSPLKGTYRRELSKAQIQSDSSPIGKITFLNCYVKARDATLTPSNIKSS